MARPLRASRDAEVVRVLLLILLANAAVAAAKIVYGLASGSLAVRADGFHSLLDGVNNVIGVVVVRVAAQPPDRGHPYGHRKFEVLGSLAIGVLILLLLVQVGGDAVAALGGGRPPARLGTEAYAVVTGTLAVNAVVAAVEHRAGRRLRSPMLLADARHTFSDVFVTAAVLGGVAGTRAGWPAADAVAALGVLVPVAAVGWGIFRQGIASLADEAVLPEADLRAEALAQEGVRACDRARSRGAAGDVRVDMVIEVDGALTLSDAHAIADRVESAVSARWPDVAEVVVHVEPHRT